MAGKKRKSIRPGVRFDVFKRDGFACQYCGRTPPTVVLQVDHIVPVAKGGENDEGNLLTACEDCNSGKSDKSLKDVPESLSIQMERRQERSVQVSEYNQFLLRQREKDERAIDKFEELWSQGIGDGTDIWRFSLARRNSILRFMEKLTRLEISDAAVIAFDRVPPQEADDDATFRYFCGICWNKIKERGTDA